MAIRQLRETMAIRQRRAAAPDGRGDPIAASHDPIAASHRRDNPIPASDHPIAASDRRFHRRGRLAPGGGT